MDKIIYLIFLFALISCETIRYADDLKFLSSAAADSPELPVFINSKICKDLDQIPGLCALRVKEGQAIDLRVEPQLYSYRIVFKCSAATGIDTSFDIKASMPWKYSILPEKFAALSTFTCYGEVYPDDREGKVSSFFEVKFMTVKASYLPRETIFFYQHKGKLYLILGSDAKYSIVWDEKNGKKIKTFYKEHTVVEVHNQAQVRAYSESYKCRFNSIGF